MKRSMNVTVGQHLFKRYDMFHVHGAERYYLTDANLVFDEKKAKVAPATEQSEEIQEKISNIKETFRFRSK